MPVKKRSERKNGNNIKKPPCSNERRKPTNIFVRKTVNIDVNLYNCRFASSFRHR